MQWLLYQGVAFPQLVTGHVMLIIGISTSRCGWASVAPWEARVELRVEERRLRCIDGFSSVVGGERMSRPRLRVEDLFGGILQRKNCGERKIENNCKCAGTALAYIRRTYLTTISIIVGVRLKRTDFIFHRDRQWQTGWCCRVYRPEWPNTLNYNPTNVGTTASDEDRI